MINQADSLLLSILNYYFWKVKIVIGEIYVVEYEIVRRLLLNIFGSYVYHQFTFGCSSSYDFVAMILVVEKLYWRYTFVS